jgi:dTDP-glucose 4,6-dehydratase
LILGGSGFVGTSLRNDLSKSNFEDVICASSQKNPKPYEVDSVSRYQYAIWDVRSKSVLQPNFDVIIHAATPASAALNNSDPREMFEIIVQGMENVIEFASRHRVPPVVLFTSSGAVYGDIPESVGNVPENWNGSVVSYRPSSAYAEGKRAAEFLLSVATSRGICKGLLARMFAFSGVNLPMDRHFAIGNFIRDAVSARTIQIRSDGSSIRSYMDQQDMANWLLRILEVGQTDAIYHVGSERSISIRDLAHLIAVRTEAILQQEVTVEVQGLKSPLDGVSRYVPSTLATRQALGVNETISLEESIDSMIHKAIKEYL